MAKRNVSKKSVAPTTFEGAKASKLSSKQILERSVLSCLLFEDTFYEDGVAISDRIASLVKEVPASEVAEIALNARHEMKLRSVPLFLVKEMVRIPEYRPYVEETLYRIIQRADEIPEFLAMYWNQTGEDPSKKAPVAASVKRALARAFNKFDAYQLKKYDRNNLVTLKDAMFLTHPKPLLGRKGYTKDARKRGDIELSQLNNVEMNWRMLVDGTLPTANTWETRMSAGESKENTFKDLLLTNKIGAMALLRNLRNMADIEDDIVIEGIKSMNVGKILPYRFITASKYAKQAYIPALEEAMMKCIDGFNKLSGRTVLLVDVSGSMDWSVSTTGTRNTDPTVRIDLATGLAILFRELCEDIATYTFSNSLVQIDSSHRGFGLAGAVKNSQAHMGTALGLAISRLNGLEKYDRLVVLTDEQSRDKLPQAVIEKSYIINLAPHQKGVGYDSYTHINGFSESVIRWLDMYEKEFVSHNGISNTEY